MADNFDSNIARRKPNVLNKRKALRPWDVPPASSVAETDPEPEEVLSEKSGSNGTIMPEPPEKVSEKPPDTPEKAEIRPPEPKIAPRPARTTPKASKPSQGLSDSINIHSNFCKLDNAVSDILFPRLSPSAQCVYLRLYRQSYGWNRNWASESLPKLSKSCNLSLQTIRKAIKELETFGCIVKEMSDYHRATVYRVLLPSEIESVSYLTADGGMSVSDTQNTGAQDSESHFSQDTKRQAQNSASGRIYQQDMRNFEGRKGISGGQESAIQSLYFLGTSIYALLESGGALPKNISKYMNDIQLKGAVGIVDEFYDSIGYSVVSREKYRKSIIDYFELIQSGFQPDDIRYAVRWTFMNSRTRPESFSLIKHTMHLAMKDFIDELRTVSGEKEVVEEKQAALDRTMEKPEEETGSAPGSSDLATWTKVLEFLQGRVNEHSYRAFIEPLTLREAESGAVTIEAPPDSLSWIDDHYRTIIEEAYREAAAEEIEVTLV